MMNYFDHRYSDPCSVRDRSSDPLPPPHMPPFPPSGSAAVGLSHSGSAPFVGSGLAPAFPPPSIAAPFSSVGDNSGRGSGGRGVNSGRGRGGGSGFDTGCDGGSSFETGREGGRGFDSGRGGGRGGGFGEGWSFDGAHGGGSGFDGGAWWKRE